MAFALRDPWQRLKCFAVLYVCEGIPQGFTETFLPTHLAKGGLSEGAIGRFGFWDGQPWAWKWALAPLVDILGSRRRWLFSCQVLMTLMLLSLVFFQDIKASFSAITALVFLHNVFSATQDVAIDAIAVGALPVAEGPAADGVMFAAQEFGNAMGGSVALGISEQYGYHSGCLFVVAFLALIFLGFTCRLHPEVGASDQREGGLVDQLVAYLRELRQALFGPGRVSFWIAVAFALFPSGALLLRGPNIKSKMVADSLSEGDIAHVELVGKVCSIASMLVGGFLSTQLGPRRLVLTAYLGSALATIWCWSELAAQPSHSLTLWQWRGIKVVFHLLHGLHIGPQMSLFRSCCSQAVAATQFTIFCALCNFADSLGKDFTGGWIEASSFQEVLLWDAAVVLVPLMLLPWVGVAEREHQE